ncbi:DNA-3-methyladenine glycosylase family protein [Paenibacillus gansuensis]|uniref:DNA-3-methyladenine glycosylase II n=1 Tax=Paenibacillus gansuensis TaxID=306542 RepID=A0ABW5PBB8_9BACL
MQQFTIRPKAPFDFERMTRRLQGVSHEMFRYEADALVRTLRVGGKVYLIAIRSTGSVEEPEVQVTVRNEASREEAGLIESRVRDILTADVDLQAFYNHVSQDPVLLKLTKAHYGLRFILEADLFECMVKTVIGQQVNLTFASTLNRRLIEAASKPLEHEGELYPVFPSAEQVAALSYEQLRENQFSQRKAEYVIDFARAVASGSLDLEELRSLESDQIMERFIKLRGIGRWTVECFLLFGLGRPNLLPAADIGLRNAVRKGYGLEEQPGEGYVRELGRAWAPWESYVTFYLWESLNQKEPLPSPLTNPL